MVAKVNTIIHVEHITLLAAGFSEGHVINLPDGGKDGFEIMSGWCLTEGNVGGTFAAMLRRRLDEVATGGIFQVAIDSTCVARCRSTDNATLTLEPMVDSAVLDRVQLCIGAMGGGGLVGGTFTVVLELLPVTLTTSDQLRLSREAS